MKLPHSLKIGAYTFKVILVKEWEGEHLGKCDYDEETISIRASLSQTGKEQTLFHEILHAINSELDHALLESLSQQLYQVLKDNRMLR